MPSNRNQNAAKRGNKNARQQGRQRAAKAPAAPRSAAANDIIGVVLIAVSVAMVIAVVVPTTAPVTAAVGAFLSLLFGRGALLAPLALALFALTFFADDEGPLSGRIAFGLALIVLAVLSLISLTYPGAELKPLLLVSDAVVLDRGGYVGGGIAWCLLSTVGFGVGIVILVGVIVIGCIVCGFSISGTVAQLRERMGIVSAGRQAAREQKRQEREMQRALTADVPLQAEAGTPADEPKTSFIGQRKTSVLRRGSLSTPSEEQKTRVLRPTRTEDLQATLLMGSEDDATLPLEVEGATTVLPADGKTKRVNRRKKNKVEQPDEAPTEITPSIPEFLKQQAASLPKPEEGKMPSVNPTSKGGNKGKEGKGAAAKTSGTQTVPAKASIAPATGVAARSGEGEPVYQLPPVEMLAADPHQGKSAATDAELESTMRRLQSTLQEFGLSSKVVDYVTGPLVTTFQIEMGEGERVSRITNLEDDIALTLAAESVRIFAPIPGTSRVGIEIPNKKRESVHLGDVLPYAKGGPLEFAVGRDSEGRAVIADLAKMPHLLVAGATGSGKSVMINSLIMSILMRDTPKQVRLILIDPKRVEFSGYNGLPHLYVPVVTEPRQAASALQWAVSEMDRRLKVFERAGARNIGAYNEMCVSGKLSEMDNPPEPMPFMVIIIDELSDLMMVAGKDVEASIVRIAQLARAAGIHLVLATQRPSANVVTGLIKSNIETRIALSVASSIDSRVILDEPGAQRLLGNGDMLFKYKGNRTRRVLGCYVSDEEIENVVDFVRSQGEPDYHEEILSQVAPNTPGGGSGGASEDEDDPLVWEAAQIVVETRLGSTSGLQRRLKVGYARAGRIMDMLEAKGVVGPPDGSKPREVLLDEDGLEELRVAEEKYREV